MKKRKMLSYIDEVSPVHALSGAAKLIIFLLWSILVMVSYKTQILIFFTAVMKEIRFHCV